MRGHLTRPGLIVQSRGFVSLAAAILLAVTLIGETSRLDILVAAIAVALLVFAAVSTRVVEVSFSVQVWRWLIMTTIVVGYVVTLFHVSTFGSGTSGTFRALLFGCLALLGVAGALLIHDSSVVRFRMFVGAFGLVGLIVILATQTQSWVIDVAVFQELGAEAFVDGQNPYTMTFPDIYPPAASDRVYGPGVSVDGVLQFGFPYFPASLLAIVPFHFLGDFRLAHLAALVVTSLFLAQLAPSANARLIAAGFLLMSPALPVIRYGWVDGLLLLALVGTIFAASQRSARTSLWFGLALAMKQLSALLVLPSVLLVDRPWSLRRLSVHFLRSFVVFAIVTMPMAIWDVGAFSWSVIELQFVQPFRPDSISIPALLRGVWEGLPSAISFGATALAILSVSVLAIRRQRSGAFGFALASAAVMATAFMMAKQAFANYYLLVIGLACAAAVLGAARSEAQADVATANRSG